MRISDWSSDVCSSDLRTGQESRQRPRFPEPARQQLPRLAADRANPLAEESHHLRLFRSAAQQERRRRAGGRRDGYPRLPAICGRSEGTRTPTHRWWRQDRKSVVWGTSVSVRVDIGGRRILTKKNNTHTQ